MDSFYTQGELEQMGFEKLGENVHISRKSSIYSAEKIRIGNNSRIDDFVILSGKIEIGNHVHISAYASIFSGNTGVLIRDFVALSSKVCVYAESDDYSGNYMTNPTVPMEVRNIVKGFVYIGKHVIVGSGTTIFPDVSIGDGAAVGAMSLVNRNINEWTINVGIPAREIKQREKQILEKEKMMNRILETKGSVDC